MGKKKHGVERVEVTGGDSVGLEVFKNPALLDAYFESLGIGTSPNTTKSNDSEEEDYRRDDRYKYSDVDYPRKKDKNPHYNGFRFPEDNEPDDTEDEESALGAQIADMVFNKIGAKVVPNGDKKPEKTAPVDTRNVEVTKVVKETRVTEEVEQVKESKDEKKKRPYCPIATVRVMGGVNHIVLRDCIGNSVSVPMVSSGDTKILDKDVDQCLRELYIYRKLTGMPSAVYLKEEIEERLDGRLICFTDIDYDRFIFMTSEAFDDYVFVYDIGTENQIQQFIEFMKISIPRECMSDTILALTSNLAITSQMLVDNSITNWFLSTYVNEDSMKNSLEAEIDNALIEPNENNDEEIEYSDYDEMLQSGFASIGAYIMAVNDNVEEAVYSGSDEEDEDEDDAEELVERPVRTEKDFETFNPYAPSNEEEREDEGASTDGKTFPENDVDARTEGISRENDNSVGERHDVSGDSNHSDSGIQGNPSGGIRVSSGETEKETAVERGLGATVTTEVREEKTEGKEEGIGSPEIDEVDPESFSFEEEPKEKKGNMVIGVMTI